MSFYIWLVRFLGYFISLLLFLGWKDYKDNIYSSKIISPRCASHSNDPIRLSFAQFLTSCRYIWQIWTDSGQFSFTMCLKIYISIFFPTYFSFCKYFIKEWQLKTILLGTFNYILNKFSMSFCNDYELFGMILSYSMFG